MGFSLLSWIGCASTPKRPVSDHYDGKKFYNPTLGDEKLPGFSDAFRLMGDKRAKWPESVENQGTPSLKEKLAPDGMAITFINHATFLIQFPGLNILTDPVWSKRASPFGWIGPKRVRPPGVPLDDLPEIHLILISHNHYDHLDLDTLKDLQERFSPQVVVAAGDKQLVESVGMVNVHELDWWEDVEIRSGSRVTFTPSQHSSARGLFDRDESLWGSFFIQNGQRSVYFGGDAGYSIHFAETSKRLGGPDVALLGIGAYAPRWFMKPIHTDPAEAVVAHKDLGAKLSIGMHYGTFQLSSEGFDQPQEDLEQAMKKEGVAKNEFITLNEGETKVFGPEDFASKMGTKL